MSHLLDARGYLALAMENSIKIPEILRDKIRLEEDYSASPRIELLRISDNLPKECIKEGRVLVLKLYHQNGRCH